APPSDSPLPGPAVPSPRSSKPPRRTRVARCRRAGDHARAEQDRLVRDLYPEQVARATARPPDSPDQETVGPERSTRHTGRLAAVGAVVVVCVAALVTVVITRGDDSDQ